MAEICLFCRIARHEIPVPFLAESERCVAFCDISPQAPKHFLVIPREHFDSLNALTDSTLIGEMMIMARDVAAVTTDHRLIVRAPARLADRLRQGRSEALRGEAWLLAGTGQIRHAALIDLV